MKFRWSSISPWAGPLFEPDRLFLEGADRTLVEHDAGRLGDFRRRGLLVFFEILDLHGVDQAFAEAAAEILDLADGQVLVGGFARLAGEAAVLGLLDQVGVVFPGKRRRLRRRTADQRDKCNQRYAHHVLPRLLLMSTLMALNFQSPSDRM